MEYNTVDIIEAFKKIANQYRDEFSSLSMEQLNKPSHENEWSIGTIMNHLVKPQMILMIKLLMH